MRATCATTVSGLRTALGVSAVAGALVLAVAPAGSAAAAPAVPALPGATSTDVAAANQAAAAPDVTLRLSGFFARLTPDGKPLALQAGAAAPTAAAAPRLVGATVPVYYLNPAFVTAKYGTAPVAEQEFMATAAVSASGQHASVWTAPDKAHPGAWKEVNIASGSNETDMAAAAARAGYGGVAFYEPQIHAWYTLVKDHVTPLNADAVRSVGSHGISLAGYQHLVNTRYADKLPGTDYANRHMLGGFSRGPEKSAGGMNTSETILVGSVGLAGLVGAGSVLKRRRRRGAADAG